MYSLSLGTEEWCEPSQRQAFDPKCQSKTAYKSMSWSTQSKAALRSSSTSSTDRSLDTTLSAFVWCRSDKTVIVDPSQQLHHHRHGLHRCSPDSSSDCCRLGLYWLWYNACVRWGPRPLSYWYGTVLQLVLQCETVRRFVCNLCGCFDSKITIIWLWLLCVCCLFWLPYVCWWHIVDSFCTVSAMRHMLMTCDLCRWLWYEQ